MSSENKIKAILILEIIGKPAEHIVKSLEKIIEDIGNEKGVDVIERKVHEAKEMKEREDFFTSFAEVEVGVEDLAHIAMLMFKYMPANVEIVEPESLSMSNNDLSEIFSELVRRLHQYDEVARVLKMKYVQLQKKLKETEKNSDR